MILAEDLLEQAQHVDTYFKTRPSPNPELTVAQHRFCLLFSQRSADSFSALAPSVG
jgi:hypothetical protein